MNNENENFDNPQTEHKEDEIQVETLKNANESNVVSVMPRPLDPPPAQLTTKQEDFIQMGMRYLTSKPSANDLRGFAAGVVLTSIVDSYGVTPLVLAGLSAGSYYAYKKVPAVTQFVDKAYANVMKPKAHFH